MSEELADPPAASPSSIEALQEEIVLASAPAATFEELAPAQKRDVFFLLPESVQRTLVTEMATEVLRRFVGRLDPDEATDVLGHADEETRSAVLAKLDADRREKVEYLLEFSPGSAAGLMHLDFVTVGAQRSFEEVARRVRRHEERTGRHPTIFVTGEEGKLLGELPAQTLVLEDTEQTPITEHVHEIPTIRYDASDEEVIELFEAHPERRIAVLGEENQVLGAIYAEDLLRIVREQVGETLYEFTGVAEEESVLDGPLAKIRSRYLWLIVNLGTAFLAAAVVGLFEATIAAFTLLAVYMPVVAGMGGNAGTQSMAVTVRGLALDQVSLRTGGRVIRNEMLAGAANGAINGLLVAGIASFFNQSPLLGLVLGVSMVLNLVIAAFFGTLIPLILDRLGKDPATSATIFITTATDVLGFFIFLGMAKAVLGI